MSRKANGYDDAMIESFWRTLKTESTGRNHFKTRAQARLAVFDFIECFCHPHRRDSSIGGVSLVAFETLNNSTPKTSALSLQKSGASPESRSFKIPRPPG